MYCQRCGRSMDDGYVYCTNCGALLDSCEEPYPAPEPGHPEALSAAQAHDDPPLPAPRRSALVPVLLVVLILSLALTALLAFGVIRIPWGGAAAQAETVAEPETDPYAVAVSQPPVTPEAIMDEPAPETAESAYILPDSDTRRLDKSELAGLSWERLCLARNEIFARHGLIFGVKEIDDYFLAQSWYTPVSGHDEFSFASLSDIETANAATIYDYEISHFGKTYY